VLTRVCGKNLNNVSMCAVSPMVHTSNIYSCKKKKNQFYCGCEQFHLGRSFGFLVINVSNHTEHYETPCILLHPIARLKMWNKECKLYLAKNSNCSVQYSLKLFSVRNNLQPQSHMLTCKHSPPTTNDALLKMSCHMNTYYMNPLLNC